MKRAQMRRHQFTWIVLAPILASLVAGALVLKPDPDAVRQNLPRALQE